MATIRDLLDDGIEFEGYIIVEVFYPEAETDNLKVVFHDYGDELDGTRAWWLDRELSAIYTSRYDDYPCVHLQINGE